MCEFNSFRLEDAFNDSDIFSLFINDFNFDESSLHLFNDIPMIQWRSDDVLRFINDELTLFCTNDEQRNRYCQRFQSFSGYMFSNLNEENCQFVAQSNSIGTVIYRAKEWHLTNEQNSAINLDNIGDNNYDNNQPATPDSDPGHDTMESRPRRPGRPRASRSSIKNKIGKRSQKLWEFILHLLQDVNTCPNLIKWDNFEEGTFQFVESAKVARLWGSRKNNDNMNYEKFSRAMRYYYKSQVLLPVPGRRLVYKFGPRAKGWRQILPHH